MFFNQKQNVGQNVGGIESEWLNSNGSTIALKSAHRQNINGFKPVTGL